jgi:CubicO group peptidase (beta-lactamase class C family)
VRGVLTAVAIVVAVPALAFVGWAATQNDGSRPELGALLDRVVDSGAPGALAVVRDGPTVRVEARGYADRAAARPMRADDRFRIGSVTKTFVAALVLQLVEQGRLRLDDPVERWLPALVPGGGAITVRHLLSHTAGLPDYVEDPRLRREPERRWTPRELVALARPAERAAPGGGFAYSSTDYILLGLIVEEAGGAALGDQLRDRLFEPLGLRRTSFEPGELHGRYVHGYRAPSHQGVVTGAPADIGARPAWWTWAAGGIVSTPADVQRFFAGLLRGRVLRPALLREMESLVPAGRQRYGLGIATFPTPCGAAWGHTGNVQGIVAVAWNTRDASRQVVLVVNTYPLSGELEAAVRQAQFEAFCGGA